MGQMVPGAGIEPDASGIGRVAPQQARRGLLGLLDPAARKLP